MNEPFRFVLLEHLRRYPRMKTEDFMKLIYQSVFGPRHFSGVPCLSDIIAGIEDEVRLMEPIDEAQPIYVDLGSDFVRVSLCAISSGLWTVTEMAEAFLASFSLSPSMNKATLKRWNDRVNTFLEMNAEGILHCPETEMDAALEDISRYGVRPTHHSETYRKAYHPHYRVIHRQLIESRS